MFLYRIRFPASPQKYTMNMNKVLVCGCGKSLLQLKEIPENIVTIGVNDCGKMIQPDYLLVVDNDFSTERRKTIESCSKKSVLVSHIPEYFTEFNSKIKIEIGEYGKLNNLYEGAKIDYSTTSTYMSIIFAYKFLCADRIAMLGVDFTNGHYNNDDGKYKLDLDTAKLHYGMLCNALSKRNCELVNVSDVSLIDTVPHLDLDKWLEK